jgi:hypothetical protein
VLDQNDRILSMREQQPQRHEQGAFTVAFEQFRQEFIVPQIEESQKSVRNQLDLHSAESITDTIDKLAETKRLLEIDEQFRGIVLGFQGIIAELGIEEPKTEWLYQFAPQPSTDKEVTPTISVQKEESPIAKSRTVPVDVAANLVLEELRKYPSRNFGQLRDDPEFREKIGAKDYKAMRNKVDQAIELLKARGENIDVKKPDHKERARGATTTISLKPLYVDKPQTVEPIRITPQEAEKAEGGKNNDQNWPSVTQ